MHKHRPGIIIIIVIIITVIKNGRAKSVHRFPVRIVTGMSLFVTGMSGMVVLDNNGDREPDYWISDMDPASGIFLRIAEVLNTDNGERVSCRIWPVVYFYVDC